MSKKKNKRRNWRWQTKSGGKQHKQGKKQLKNTNTPCIHRAHRKKRVERRKNCWNRYWGACEYECSGWSTCVLCVYNIFISDPYSLSLPMLDQSHRSRGVATRNPLFKRLEIGFPSFFRFAHSYTFTHHTPYSHGVCFEFALCFSIGKLDVASCVLDQVAEIVVCLICLHSHCSTSKNSDFTWKSLQFRLLQRIVRQRNGHDTLD